MKKTIIDDKTSSLVKIDSSMANEKNMPGAVDLKAVANAKKEESERAIEETSSKYLPRIFFANEKNTKVVDEHKLVLKGMGEERRVTEPFGIIHILTREMVRDFDREKKRYTNRCYSQLFESPGETSEEFEASRDKAERRVGDLEIGKSHLVAILEYTRDGLKSTLANIEAVGAGADTWVSVLSQAYLEDGKISRFSTSDFSFAVAIAKKSKYPYIAGWKIDNADGEKWSSGNLTQDEADSVAESYKKQIEQIELFTKL